MLNAHDVHKKNKEHTRTRVLLLQKKITLNPNDGESLYELSVHLKNGHGGLPKDAAQSEVFLQRAAESGYQVAKDIIAKKIAFDKGLQDRKEMDEKYKANAESMFRNKNDLLIAIEKKILPSVVSISTNEGIGTGFFQHQMWLVSNAHVLPTYRCLNESTLSNPQIAKVPIALERSFHRPNEEPKSPDIVIVKLKSDQDQFNTAIPAIFSESECHTSSCFFYVYYDSEENPIIKYLTPCSHDPYKLNPYESSAFPLYFQCEDRSDPSPGCSGSPVIEARVTVGHSIQWEFRTVGMVFARCPHPTDITKSKLVCVIPVAIDFKQIHIDILAVEQMSERYAAMSVAHDALYQTEEANVAKANAGLNKALAAQGLHEFNAGVTSLNISLPPGLEKLIGKEGIISLKQSLLLAGNQAEYPKARFKETADDITELESALEDFFIEIENTGKMLNLQKGDSFLVSKLFRIDVLGGTGSDWRLDLQDNTGVFKLFLSEKHHKLLYSNNKKEKKPKNLEPASSVFATVKVKVNIKSISSRSLVYYLKQSMDIGIAVEYDEQLDKTKDSEMKKEPKLSEKETKLLEKEKKSQAYLESLELESYDGEYAVDTHTATTATTSTTDHADMEDELPDLSMYVPDQLDSLEQPSHESTSGLGSYDGQCVVHTCTATTTTTFTTHHSDTEDELPDLLMRVPDQLASLEQLSHESTSKLGSYDGQYAVDTCTTTTTTTSTTDQASMEDKLMRVQAQLASLTQPSHENTSKTDRSEKQGVSPKKLLASFSTDVKGETITSEALNKKSSLSDEELVKKSTIKQGSVCSSRRNDSD